MFSDGNSSAVLVGAMLNSRMRSFLIRDILGPGEEQQRDDKDCEILHQQVTAVNSSRCPNGKCTISFKCNLLHHPNKISLRIFNHINSKVGSISSIYVEYR
ncbi:homeobox domain-containing protein [Caerostris darwini]|uniref:Homeobox domain-containing protein n=1 Tax=Caerostris darwini TaxID=1538125 RepID=A0AAV4VPU3_9ARAC|nr:homeobox domain-containing protein [Caerostris darwini]